MLFHPAQQLERSLHGVGAAAVEHERPIRARASRAAARTSSSSNARSRPSGPQPSLSAEYPASTARLGDPPHVVRCLRHHLARIDRDLVEPATTEELTRGSPGDLAGNVPEGDVDRADHVERGSAPPVVVARVEHQLPQAIDLQRILAHQHLSQTARDRVGRRHLDDRSREQRSRIGLADAHDALVGVDRTRNASCVPSARVASTCARRTTIGSTSVILIGVDAVPGCGEHA